MSRLTPSDVDAQAIRDATARVLSGPDYEPARPGPIARAFEAVIDAVAAGLNTLVSAGGGAFGLAVLVVVVVGITAIAYALLRRVRRDRRQPAEPGRIQGRTADDWRRDADAHAASGAWASALRCHYRALLADLVAAGIIEEVAGRTAREYEREIVAAAPATAAPMTAVTAAFETAWYEGAEIDAGDVDRLRVHADAVRRQLLVAA